jgi:aldose 1-epimerase
MEYNGKTDNETILNLTNHVYWNLSGNLKSKITSHHIKLYANECIPINKYSIPTGDIATVTNTPFDLRNDTLLNDIIPLIDGGGEPGIDHCFVITNNVITNDETYTMRRMVDLEDRTSGRILTVYGTQPGIQIYTGNFLSKDINNSPHIQHNAICLESQHFPDSINHNNFPSIILTPNQQYYQKAIFKLSTKNV